MRFNYLKASLKTAVLITTVLLLGAGLAVAQQQINLTAAPASLIMPDGSTVPMWGYSCGTAVIGSTAGCAPLNPAVAVGGWSPVVITVPTGQDLTINLTNNLSFTPTGSTTANNVPTSLVIVGQLGGGLGVVAQRTTTPAPDHSGAQAATTWPIAGGAGTLPPAQGPRVQSFATEVTAGATTALTWTAPRPGTYLIESGTHPSIQGPMGLYGILVVTTAPAGTTAGTAYGVAGTATAVSYNAEIPLLLSEIDPVQNNSVNTAVNTSGFTETAVWSGQPGGCGNPASATYHTCYPPAVNYTPLYYLINGVAFDKTHASTSLFSALPASGVSGNVLVRLVNAGLRMHVPSIVGADTTQTVGTTSSVVPGFSLIAEDGNQLPGNPRVQSEVFMAAGKTYDVMINAPAAGGTALPIFDRELSLSGNAIARDAGMLAYLNINSAVLPATSAFAAAAANPDTYNSVIAGQTLTVSDPAKGVIANDVNVYGVQVVPGSVTGGTLTLNSNGTFTFAATAGSGSFQYCANGTTSGTTGAVCTSVTLGAAPMEGAGGITMGNIAYTANGTFLGIKPPGILSVDKDGAGYPLKVAPGTVTPQAGLTLSVDPNGGFNASVIAAGTYTFTYKAQNSQGTVSTASGTVTITFPAPSGLAVTVLDGADKKTAITDYRWIIEEDRTFYVDPKCQVNPPPAGCPTVAIPGQGVTGIVPTFGTNFHTSYMPVVATGCTGTLSCESGQTMIDPATGNHVSAVCDLGNGVCRPDATGNGEAPLDPSQVHLDPTKRYYISILPGDAANPFNGAYGGAPICPDPSGNGTCGHGMGGAPIAAGQTAVTILTQPTPFPPAKLSVFVFEDDFPLNGEQDGGGGIDTLSPNEPGLGEFQITLFDDAGGSGDATGQPTYDMFNMPLSNSLSGTIDPTTGMDACPISQNATVGFDGTASPQGITGMIVTCPKYETDGVTLSPLAGQAVVANLYPGRYGVVATPGADRIARGEEWLQTNTLDGQKAHDSFLRIGEPSFFQEYGPAGYHVSIGFANPAIINARKAGVCGGTDPNITGVNCNNTVTAQVTDERMSRTPDERLYSSGSYDSFAFTQCYVSFGDPDGEDFAFTKCNADGTFTLSGLPDGDWRITVFDQWNDMLVDGLSTPVRLSGGRTLNLSDLAMNQWQANIYTSTFFDANGDGVRQSNEAGLSLVSTNIRFRDGSFSNFNNTDLSGNAGFNEVFPLFSWYVIESDSTRYKNTGTHVVYDAGGPADGTPCGGTTGTAPCGSSTIAGNMANTAEQIPLPSNLHVPGAFYCANADCTDAPAPLAPGGTGGSTGRVDPPWVLSEGWQGFSGQNSFVEFGKKPYAAGENGGIRGHVVYASTRPFDDPQLLLQLSWEPQVPGVTINLYQEGTAVDGSQSLTLVDTTKTSSFDDWAQGFRSDGVPNMNCPGQGRDTGTAADLFFFTLYDQPMWLDMYNHAGFPTQALPANSQFKCYDGMHNWNQVQPAPYDGMYQFPSIIGRNPTTGAPTGTGSTNGTAGSRPGTNCTICVANPTDGTPMLPAGKYVVEVVVPPGYELVKEEDKNILIGDNYIAPVTQQFAGLGNIFILPDQAAVGATYNANNAQNATQDLGRVTFQSHEGDTGSVESFWPCVGAARIVPDYISLFPQSGEVSPFAGATRNLCDRKEVTVTDQASALAKFYVFTSTHAAAHFTGVITDDYTSEFDPFSPQFGEKFSPANLPVSIKDWAGNEISRVYSDQWGTYNGLTYSTWEVNPPNPTGYAPQMMVTCMNDPGTGPTPDPLFNSQYSQFCYEIPFMPGQTQYMDTPVVPTSAFAGAGYNNPDCAYPDATPAVKEVDGDGLGPWLNASGALQLTITALGDQLVPDNAYSGPSAHTAPFNQKTVLRHYGFGSRPTTCGNGANCPNVTIGGINAVVQSWTDTSIVATARAVGQIPLCAVQQQAIYGGSQARCGQLVITAANGKQSIDTVTVTIGGKAPTHVHASDSIQSAIDAAAPGDLIIVDPTFVPSATAPPTTSCAGVTAPTATCVAAAATHQEILLMWKPVRLQGVGAASSIINANTHPAGKLDVWRREVNCLMGLSLNGTPISGTNPYDSTGTFSCPGTGWANFVGAPNSPQVDRLPLEATVGWDANLNGNLAEMLQEPSLMGALEGAAITVLSKGVDFHGQNPFDSTLLAGFPAGTTLLTAANCGGTGANPFPSSFQCNPSSIDGLGITDSSQGGGGIFVHGWGHNIQIANNRIYNNAGTLSGGINVGQGEFPPAYLQGSATNAPPGSCESSNTANVQLPYCHNLNVNVHHNSITSNSSTGDELFSATPAGAGGVSFCTGSDYYKFNYNWLCGNLSSGDGGGLGHLGFSKNGQIAHNSILFNQSTNPTIPANGGGIIIMGAPDVDPPCGLTTDSDCVPPLGSVGPSDGIGPGLVVDANLIMGNAAESGSGGGIRLQAVNGAEVISFPNNPEQWYTVNVTNNIITNNVAGWDGAGISLLDALAANIVNNTIMSNDTTASSGVLFNTLGAPLASSGGPCPYGTAPPQPCVTTSTPQPAGLVSIQNSPTLIANFPATITCPAGHYAGTTASNGTCRQYSYPVLANDVFWQNRAFNITVGSLGTGTQNQQNVVALVPTLNQTATGSCQSGANYWDIGVRGDTGPGDHSAGLLNPTYSVLTSTSGYGSTNMSSNPAVTAQYCNGSRVPPEFGGMGYLVPPGISDATVPNPIFNLTPAATVDEGNNWINIAWGPLALTNPVTGTVLGNYTETGSSPTIDAGTPESTYTTTDFFGTTRPQGNGWDIGAVELAGTAGGGGGGASATLTPTSHAFGTVTRGSLIGPVQIFTLTNTGTVPLTGITQGTLGGTNPTEFTIIRLTSTCGPAGGGQLLGQTTLAPGATCVVSVQFRPLTSQPPGAKTATVSVTDAAGTQTSTLSGTAR
jgi:hypothetical protein